MSQKVCVPATGKLLWLSSRDSPSANLKTGQKTQAPTDWKIPPPPPKARPILFEVPGNVQGPISHCGLAQSPRLLATKMFQAQKVAQNPAPLCGISLAAKQPERGSFTLHTKKESSLWAAQPPKKIESFASGRLGKPFLAIPRVDLEPASPMRPPFRSHLLRDMKAAPTILGFAGRGAPGPGAEARSC